MKKTLDLTLLIQPESMAQQISDKYITWRNERRKKETDWLEVRKYVFATDTTTTTNSKLPWKNKTTRPKLCQIRDNLYANYMAALFPNDDWFIWQGGDDVSATKDKKLAIEAYMKHIFRSSKFKKAVSQQLLDWIDYGNTFADVYAVNETTKLPGGPELSIYTGPKVIRISPLDIVFDITAPSFEDTPTITKTMLSLGQIHKLRATAPEWKNVTDEILAKMASNRNGVVAGGGRVSYDQDKASALTADGFASLIEYYASGKVEVLEFQGDFFDVYANKLYENYRITVVDRAYVVRKEPISNWYGTTHRRHCGWRLRPDNLVAMGPLDNLVGLQYRLDHLENLKADVFDMIAYPTKIVKGYVEEFEDGPGERIYMEQDATVEFIRPDTTALNADLQIQLLEASMEEMAGAPKQAIGIRTPGEKTAFEVQTLDNASGRLFQSKVSYFEEFFLEPLINSMLEVARRNLDDEVLVSVVRDDLGVQEFISITRKDLTAKGRLTPMGARHFASQAQLVQNLSQLSATGLYQDQNVQAHISGKGMAKLVTEALGLTKYNVYGENIRIMEQMESQALAQQAQEELHVQAMTPADGAPDQGQPTNGSTQTT